MILLSINQFDHNVEYVLEDEVALLRPLKQEDFMHLVPFALHEPELWKYSLVSAAGKQALQDYIDLTLKARSEAKEYSFIVFDKRTNEYAGSTRLYDINLEYKTLNLGYTWYGSKFHGSGLNKHCKYLLLTFALENIRHGTGRV